MVDVKLPEGMSKADFDKLFGTFIKQRVTSKVRDTAINAAKKELVNKHKDEYDALVAKYTPQ